jgi:hypothetical protein
MANDPQEPKVSPVNKTNMKQDKFTASQNQMPDRSPPQTTAANLNKNEADFTASADAVARRAYFNYVNEGSLPGHDVQHWLKAEADLIAERNLTRTHGYSHRT